MCFSLRELWSLLCMLLNRKPSSPTSYSTSKRLAHLVAQSRSIGQPSLISILRACRDPALLYYTDFETFFRPPILIGPLLHTWSLWPGSHITTWNGLSSIGTAAHSGRALTRLQT